MFDIIGLCMCSWNGLKSHLGGKIFFRDFFRLSNLMSAPFRWHRFAIQKTMSSIWRSSAAKRERAVNFKWTFWSQFNPPNPIFDRSEQSCFCVDPDTGLPDQPRREIAIAFRQALVCSDTACIDESKGLKGLNEIGFRPFYTAVVRELPSTLSSVHLT